MVICCDHCLLVALWFRFHIELAKCLLIRFRSSDLIPKCERQKTLRTRRERNGATHASLVYNRVVAWVVCKNLCFFVWHFVITVISSFWRYLFVRIALMAWPRTWPVGSYHCIACYWLHGNGQCLKRKPISVTSQIQVCLPSKVMCDCNKYWSRNIDWSLHLFQKKIHQLCTRDLHYNKAPGLRLHLHAAP